MNQQFTRWKTWARSDFSIHWPDHDFSHPHYLLASILLLIMMVAGCGYQATNSTSSEFLLPNGFYPAGWTSDGSKLLIKPLHSPGDSPSDIPYLVSFADAKFHILENPWDFTQADGMCVRLSPDGMMILYTYVPSQESSPDTLYRIDKSGQPTPLLLATTIFGCPAWSPDSQLIAVPIHEDSGYKLHILGRDGQPERDLLSGQGYSVIDPAWSPDGKTIAFIDYDNNSLITINLDNGQLVSVVEKPDRDFLLSAPTWSPDGQYIAYIEGWGSSEGSLAIIKRDGTDKQYLSSVVDPYAPKDTDYLYSHPMWSPDGDYIAVSRIRSTDDFSLGFLFEVALIPVPDELKK